VKASGCYTFSVAIETRADIHSLPRLDVSCYRADAAALWTFTTFDRKRLSLNDSFHSRFRELLLHTCVREQLLCPAYVLMPDHLHLVLIGTEPDSDQLNGVRFLRTHLARAIKPLHLQPQAHDHVFTGDERRKLAFAKACRYVLLNPTRAALVEKADAWNFVGTLIPGYPNLNPFADDFWPKFWKIFATLRNPACDSHKTVRHLCS
jgi:putative transposase